MKLGDLKKGLKIEGLHPSGPTTIRDVEPMGELLEVIFRTAGGEVLTEMLRQSDESRLSIVDDRLKFDADPSDFKLGLEARRMQLSHYFDPMMAVHTVQAQLGQHPICKGRSGKSGDGVPTICTCRSNVFK